MICPPRAEDLRPALMQPGPQALAGDKPGLMQSQGKKAEVDNVITIERWTKTRDGRKARARFDAVCIEKRFAKSTRFRLENGTMITVKNADIISVEKEA